jgi:hypothetical protein
MGKDGKDATRLTVTFSKAQAVALTRLAERENVKVPWLIRRAVDRLVEDAQGGPLLPLGEPGGRDRAA